jgi:hypothetical protein
MPVCVDDDIERARAAIRPWVGLYVGGMGSRAKNFYNQTVSRYGFAEDAAAIQDLYLGGKKLEAIQKVSNALVDSVTIAGPPPRIKERLKTCADAGVTLLTATIYASDQAGRLRTLEVLSAQAP